MPLGGGASIRVRPAQQADVDECSARAQRDMMGLVSGSESGALLSSIFGDGFSIEALSDPARVSAAAERLAEMHLVMTCNDGWSGIGTEDGAPLDAPSPEYVLLLMNDPRCRRAVMDVINAVVHGESEEKKESPALRHGGAGDPAIATSAEGSASPVRMGGVS
ncbi:MAG: hypothetical protein AB7V13_23740 [Pseudorhodoplanes sp.]|uniref:hypothetical protein n=1 Tax=Pseudorhodoplanes sp. TaxID=1934341 RepID=UPI003D10EADA